MAFCIVNLVNLGETIFWDFSVLAETRLNINLIHLNHKNRKKCVMSSPASGTLYGTAGHGVLL